MTDKIPLDREPTKYDGRDAVHLAITPVIAGEDLACGEHVGWMAGKEAFGKTTYRTLGIVNPFERKRQRIKKGQLFWLILYPNTITGLHHVWSHPDFPAESKIPEKPSALQHIELIAKEVGVEPQDLMNAAERYLAHGDYWNMGELFEGVDFPYEFWDYYEELTGKTVEEKNSFFTCSC